MYMYIPTIVGDVRYGMCLYFVVSTVIERKKERERERKKERKIKYRFICFRTIIFGVLSITLIASIPFSPKWVLALEIERGSIPRYVRTKGYKASDRSLVFTVGTSFKKRRTWGRNSYTDMRCAWKQSHRDSLKLHNTPELYGITFSHAALIKR